MPSLWARKRNRRLVWSAANSSENGSAKLRAANRFSADVSAATLVLGVTTSISCTARGGCAARSSMDRRRRQRSFFSRGELGNLARGGRHQAVLGRARLDGERQACAAGKQQPFALRGAQQILALVGGELEGVGDHVDGRRVLLQQQLHGRVDEDCAAMVGAQEVGGILGDGDQPEVILA